MAVAFSTGGSGYTRSDFMISDAAIPQRVEEAVQDQSEKFSNVLSGIGKQESGSAGAPAKEAKTAEVVQKFTEKNGQVDFKAMAQAVENGELKLEDIPDEMLTSVLQELMKLVEDDTVIDVDKKDDSDSTSDAAQAVTEIASMFMQPAVQTDDKTEEISQLTAAAPVEEVTEVTEVTEVLVQEAPAEAVVQETVQPTSQEQPAFQPKAEQTGDGQAEAQQEIQAIPADNTPKQESSFTGQDGRQEDSQMRDITKFEVKTADNKQSDAEEAPVFAEHTAQRSRVVSKSDELDMIKSANTEKTDDSAAQTFAQPQGIISDKPVIFTREDGSEVSVKPADVAQQIVDRLVERTEGLKEGETEYSITLTPEDLGRITVKMTKTADGAVSVSIAAENSRTLRILEDNGTAIQDSLRQNGVQLENWQTVSESQQEMRSQDYQGSSKNPYREAERHNQDDEDGESFAEIIASM